VGGDASVVASGVFGGPPAFANGALGGAGATGAVLGEHEAGSVNPAWVAGQVLAAGAAGSAVGRSAPTAASSPGHYRGGLPFTGWETWLIGVMGIGTLIAGVVLERAQSA